MGSTLRNDTHRAVFLAEIAKAWDRRPDLSFGELLGLSFTYEERERIAQIIDATFIASIKRAVEHTNAPPTPPPPSSSEGAP